MRKTLVVTGVVLTGLVGLFVVAGRGVGEFNRYVRATADTAADRVTESLPEEVHDKKLDHEMKQVRLDLIDRQTQMNLSRRQIQDLTAEVARLEGSTERRQRLLAEAYPVLKAAIDGGLTSVKFANENHSLAEFQKEMDDLLAMNDRETRQLEIKKTGLARLKKSAEDGESALAEIRHGLDATEQEVAVLRSRREQAEVETQALDLVNAATTNQDSVAASFNKSVDRLRETVDKTEARNEARRSTGSMSERQSSHTITRSFNRLESLKAIHDSAPPTVPSVSDAKPVGPATEVHSIEASKVVIEIQKKGE